MDEYLDPVTLRRRKEQERLAEERAKREQEEEARKAREDYVRDHMEGILEIEKIDLRMPILKGATRGNLNISVASLEGSAEIGGVGNYAIAGHRSHSYGVHFNRLEELEVGDIVEVDDGDDRHCYILEEKIYVDPEETWVLGASEGERGITLITCHPMINPKQRLILRGKIVE